MIDIRQWLEGLGLESYANAFEHNDIDLDLAGDLQDEDLKELGVASLGHRKRLLRAIAALKTAEPRPSAVAEPAGSSAMAGTPAEEMPTQADRRQLTVMFCDLAGSTALSTRL